MACGQVQQNLQSVGSNGNILFPKAQEYESCVRAGAADALMLSSKQADPPIASALLSVQLCLLDVFPGTVKWTAVEVLDVIPQTPEVFFQAGITQLDSHLTESHFLFKELQLVALSLHPILDTNVKETL